MTERTKDKTRKPTRPQRNKVIDDFRLWLAGLGTAAEPSIHINGPSYATAVLAVDFGNTLEDHRLTQEQNAELIARIRSAAKSLFRDDVNIRVQNDNSAGIWWASLG